MRIKKLALTVALLAVCFGTVTVDGFAYGPRRQYVSRQYAVCPLEDCVSTAYHTHDGVTYCPRYDEDGNAYHTQYATCHGQGGCRW